MEVVDILGWIALIITLIYTGLGLPAQIRKNLLTRSTGGLSLFMTVLLFLTFSTWVAYGLVKPDWYIVVPNLTGAVCALVILWQFWRYGTSE